jgi:hypothetical protein
MTTTELCILWAVAIVCLLLGRLTARMDARQDRADLARLRAELAAITERTLARTRARSDASRRGWATRQGRVDGGKAVPTCAYCGAHMDADGKCPSGHWALLNKDGGRADISKEGRP